MDLSKTRKKYKKYIKKREKILEKLKDFKDGKLSFEKKNGRPWVRSATHRTSQNYEMVHPKIYGSNIQKLWKRVRPGRDAGNAYWASAGRDVTITVKKDSETIDVFDWNEGWDEDGGYKPLSASRIRKIYKEKLASDLRAMEYDLGILGEILEEHGES